MESSVHRKYCRSDPQSEFDNSILVEAKFTQFQLANLESLAVYFDTDSPSMAGLPTAEAIRKFSDMVSIPSLLVYV